MYKIFIYLGSIVSTAGTLHIQVVLDTCINRFCLSGKEFLHTIFIASINFNNLCKSYYLKWKKKIKNSCACQMHTYEENMYLNVTSSTWIRKRSPIIFNDSISLRKIFCFCCCNFGVENIVLSSCLNVRTLCRWCCNVVLST